MAAIYGHRWTTSYAASPTREDGSITVEGDTWSRGLLGVAPAQIAVGIERCITGGEPWPPTLPEFRAMCLGIPSLFDVRQELRPGTPTPSPFARAVWSRLDGWAYQRAEAHAAERMLREAYEATREAVMRGEPLPDEPAEILDHVKSERLAPASPEAASEQPRDRGRPSAAYRGGAMNPSAADETQDDSTIRRCIGFAKAWGYAGLCMTNLFAYRATFPEIMMAFDAPVGPENDAILQERAKGAGVVVAAWGARGTHQRCDRWVRGMLPRLHYLRLTKVGHPGHPLRLPKTLVPQPWASTN